MESILYRGRRYLHTGTAFVVRSRPTSNGARSNSTPAMPCSTSSASRAAGRASTQCTDEVRALRHLHKHAKGPFVFETERGGPFTHDVLNKQLKNIAANGRDDCGEARWAINTST